MLRIAALFSLLLAAGSAFGDSTTFVSCDGVGSERSITFEGSLILNRRFIAGEKITDAEAKAAIHHQLKYVRAAYIYPEINPSARFLPSAGEADIAVTSIVDTKYPSSFTTPAVKHADVSIEIPYVKAAIARGKAEASDSAYTITYSAKMTGLFCASEEVKKDESEKDRVEFSLPTDPYLAYWSIGVEKFRKIRWKYSAFKTNPCADAELADLPHPEYYWYFYRPSAHGKDLRGHKFSCADELKAGTHYRKFTATLLPTDKNTEKLTPLRLASLPQDRALSGTVIFGIIDPSLKRTTLEKGDYPSIRKKMAKFLQGKKVDRGSRYFASFIQRLGEVFTENSIHFKSNGDTYQVSATLRRSERPVVFDLYFGPTDLLAGEAPRHWTPFAKAVAYQDFVLYNGHSGLGENYSVENLKKFTTEVKTKAALEQAKPPAYQLVAYLSCYSYSYFKHDFIEHQRKRRNDAKVDVITTASEFTSERGPLGVFDLIDRTFSGRASHPTRRLATGYFTPEDALLVHEF